MTAPATLEPETTSDVVQRRLPVSTTLRFALLLGLILCTGFFWLDNLATHWSQTAVRKDVFCKVATGLVPDSGDVSALRAYRRCMGGIEPPDRTLTFLAVLAVLALALSLYAFLPTWKRIRRGLVALDVPADAPARSGGTPTLEEELSELRRTAGLPAHRVRFVLDPLNLRSSAVVFGRFGRCTVSLHSGLVSRRQAEPEVFRSVVLHELNHVVNRDVDLTYATISLWRAFVLAILLPVVVLDIHPYLGTGSFADSMAFWGANLSYAIPSLLLVGVIAALVYLVRADILRTREFHADALPESWGADVSRSLTAPRKRGWRWRSHPSDVERLRALREPSFLFRTNAVPFFTTGVLAVAVPSRSPAFLIAGPWGRVVVWGAGALAVGLVVIMLARSVRHSVRHGHRVRKGFAEGLWFGSGLVAGELVIFRDVGNSVLPQRPWLLLLFLVGALALCGWTAQVVQLLSRRPAGGSARTVDPFGVPALALVLGTAVTAFGTWLAYWSSWGHMAMSGSRMAVVPLLREVPAPDGGWVPLPPELIFWLPLAHRVRDDPVAVAGATLLWLVPAAAGLWRSRHGRAGDPASRRRVLLTVAGSVGGSLWAAGVLFTVHRVHPPPASWTELELTVFYGWLTAALVVPAALVAAVAAVALPSPRLLNGLVVGGGALLGGLAGVWGLTALDGCVALLSVWGDACTPTWSGSWSVLGDTSRFVLPVGMFVVVAVAALAAGGREWLGPLTERKRLVRGRPLPPRTGDAPAVGARRHALHRLVLGAMVSATCVLGVQAVADAADDSGTVDADTSSGATRLRTQSWLRAGGNDLLLGFEGKVQAYARHLRPLVEQAVADGAPEDAELGDIINASPAETPTVKRNCAALEQQAHTASRFIPIPDERAQSLWRKILSRTKKGGDLCVRGAGGSSSLLTEGTDLLLSTGELHEKLDARLLEIQGRTKG